MTTTDIICTECNTKPRLQSLDKNSGTCVGCDCDGAKYSMDMVPYEYTVHDLPDGWEIVDGDSLVRDGSEEIPAEWCPLQRERVLVNSTMTTDDPIDSEERMRRVVEADGRIAGYKAYFGAWVEIARRKLKR